MGGINKALIEINGVKIIDRNIALLKPLFYEVVISGWPDRDYLPQDVRLINDNYSGSGPLAGIESVLKASQTPYVFVFAGDMPLLSEKVIKEQTEMFLSSPVDILVPRSGKLLEPLHAIFNTAIHPAMVDFIMLNKDPSIRDFFPKVNVAFFDVEQDARTLRSFTNINTDSDLEIL